MRPELIAVLYVFPLLLAVAALRMRDLVAAAFMLGGYSYLLCLIWTEMGAVDVALTEAAVGAGVSTALFVAAIHRTRRLAAPEEGRKDIPWLRPLAAVATITMGVLLAYGCLYLPGYGDGESAPSLRTARYYVEHAMEDTHVPNLVTAVLADYRGYDTMFETIVAFAAGTAVALMLRRPHRKATDAPKKAGAAS